jgi:predicted nucleic acid-binding protein
VTWQARAQVVDIGRDVPCATDRMWVDTNVWIKVAWTRTSVNEARAYARYIGLLKKADATLVTSGVVFAEVAKHIESQELNLWLVRTNNTNSASMMLKTFRDDPAERPGVLSEIRRAWDQMSALAELPDVPISKACLLLACDGMDAGDSLDGADAIQLAEARRLGVTQFLTNDRDFGSVRDIGVFTANRRTLEEARKAGLLVER